MSYYGSRYSVSGWGVASRSKYGRLNSLFGEAVDQIKRAFLSLDHGDLDELFTRYGVLNGDSAEQYARKTLPRWRSGSVKLSGQSMERLIHLVPPYLVPEQRLSLLQAVLKRHRRSGASRTIKINVKEPSQGFAELQAALGAMSHQDVLAHLPASVMDAAAWLYDNDMTAARAVIAEAERKENELIQSSAAREIELLRRAISSGQVQSAAYSVEMPAGKLHVVAYSPSMCFVATACFGQNAPETQALRVWRDRYLIEREWGRRFIVWYYKNGEWFAHLATRSPAIKGLARTIIGLLALAVTTTQTRGVK